MRRFVLTLTLVVVTLAAAQPSTAQGTIFSSQSAECTGSKGHTEALYVATTNKINVYSLGAATPRLIITDGLAGVTQIAIGKQGIVYASNFGAPITFANSGVTEYQPGDTSPTVTRTNGAFSATGVAVDAQENVFVSSFYPNTVSAYRPEAVDPFLVLTKGISGPGLLAVNSSQLYVGEFGTPQILQFPSGSSLAIQAPDVLPMGALTFGGPFVVGRDGTVFAAGAVVANDLGFEEFVNEFKPKDNSPLRTAVVSTGSNAASTPFVAASGHDLYVSVSDTNTVFQYVVGKDLKLTRTINTGLNQPGPIAVDSGGCLYVGNSDGQVSVYAPGATTPLRIIPLPDFASPVALVIGP